MRNVTISLDEDLVRKAKVEAARRDMSFSKFIAELVSRELDSHPREPRYGSEYRAAMESALAQKPFLVKDPDTPWLTREEIYDVRLRRHERAALRDRPDRGYQTGTSEDVD